MDEYSRANRKLWDQWTREHEQSSFYDLAGFRAGKDRLRSIELSELGDVTGKTLLHLQCHFGMDTLAWARRGAIVTGVDLSGESIALARSLSDELDLPAQFHCTDIYELPGVLTGEFDIVFTSYGVLHWLRDLRRWGEIIAHYLKPNGIFYIVEDHPFFRVLKADADAQLTVEQPYFSDAPERVEMTGSYATGNEGEQVSFYIWNHSLGEVFNALIGAGLSIEFVHEFPYAARAKFPFMEQGPDGWWRLPARPDRVPFLFSLRARKAGAPSNERPTR
jgi:SAM-dependent methyltransferase